MTHSKASFSSAQIKRLIKLRAVVKVSPSRIRYAEWFKRECVMRADAGESPTYLFREAGLGPEFIGEKRIERCMDRWRKKMQLEDLEVASSPERLFSVDMDTAQDREVSKVDVRDVRDLIICKQTRYIESLQRQIDELIARAELTDGFAAEAARALAEQSGRQYSNLRAMMFLYTTGLRRRFGLSADEELDAVMSGIWFVSTEEDVRLCLKELNEAFLRRMDMPKQSLLTRNALQYINLHAIEGIQLNDVADKLCVSANYLSALIRKETGVTFHEHMLEARMNVARSMLADPRILVEEVARAVGYGNYISFYNAFKRIEHMTPTEYRNRKAKL